MNKKLSRLYDAFAATSQGNCILYIVMRKVNAHILNAMIDGDLISARAKVLPILISELECRTSLNDEGKALLDELTKEGGVV